MFNPAEFEDGKMHKIEIKAIEDRYVVIIDDEHIFLGEIF